MKGIGNTGQLLCSGHIRGRRKGEGKEEDHENA